MMPNRRPVSNEETLGTTRARPSAPAAGLERPRRLRYDWASRASSGETAMQTPSDPTAPPAAPAPTPAQAPAADGVEREFIDLWRNMSSLWGVSPTMAEIHGLLFFTGEVLSMDDVMARLTISR